MQTDIPPRRLATAAGLEVFDEGADVILASPAGMLRLGGGAAAAVRDRLIPALADRPDRPELLAALADLPSTDIGRLLDRLIEAGMVTESGLAPARGWLGLLSTDVVMRDSLAERLAAVRILVIGESAEVAGLSALSDAGVGSVEFADPVTLSRDDLPGLIRGRDLVICQVDAGWAAVRAWLNRACLDAGIPALYVATESSFAYVGPLVLPGEGPCYLCWRMRALACSDDFDVAMAREESLDQARRPLNRPLLPGLLLGVQSMVVREALAVTTAAMPTELSATVVVVDQLKATQRRHPVIARPDCPGCRKKARPPAPEKQPAGTDRHTTDFDAIAARTVSEVSGLIRFLDLVPKPIEEPSQPLIVRAQLANVLYGKGEDAFITCSGKGMDLTTARDGAIGEALERYASLVWTPQRRFTGTRAQVPGRALDPHELVLFTAQDAERLHHARYCDEMALDWVPALSLVSADEVWVPHQAVTLQGSQWPRHDLLFAPTSSGFAAGPDVAFAAERALLEVIERDAFMMAWMHRLRTEPIDACSVPDQETAALAALYARRGVRIDLHLLPSDSTAHVFMAVGWSDELPAAVVGLGADHDPISAARSAVLEVGQVRPALRSRLRDPDVRARLQELVDDPAKVAELADHDLLYADPATAAARMTHLRGEPKPWPSPPQRGRNLDDLVASLAAVSGDVLIVDVTPDDVADLGVRVVRGIVPGFQPIHFGADEARLGHRRLFTAPHRWGLRERPAARDDLNPDPHPLA